MTFGFSLSLFFTLIGALSPHSSKAPSRTYPDGCKRLGGRHPHVARFLWSPRVVRRLNLPCRSLRVAPPGRRRRRLRAPPAPKPRVSIRRLPLHRRRRRAPPALKAPLARRRRRSIAPQKVRKRSKPRDPSTLLRTRAALALAKRGSTRCLQLPAATAMISLVTLYGMPLVCCLSLS